MDANFDLNISNYSRKELEEIFSLEPNYTIFSLNTQYNALCATVNTKTVSPETKQKTLNFINSAKLILQDIPAITPTPSSIQKPETPYINSFQSEYYAGTLNPLKKRTLEYAVNVDSRFRPSAQKSSDYLYTLPEPLSNVVSMHLSSIELPTSFFTINAANYNNTFEITVNGTQHLITLPTSSYSASDLVNVITSQFTLLSVTYPEMADIEAYVNVNPLLSGTNQTVIQIKTGAALATTMTLNFDTSPENVPIQMKLGWILGFREALYTGNTSYTSEGQIDVSGPKYLFLAVDDMNNSVNDSFIVQANQSIVKKNIIARIGLNNTSFSTVIPTGNSVVSHPRKYFGPVQLQKMRILLLNEYGVPVDLNYMDYSFCLSVTTLYDL